AVHADGALLLLGGPGTGKTDALLARFAWLTANGTAPERIALLASGASTAAALRAQVEALVQRAYEELVVATVPELCARLLRSGKPAAGLDPFAVSASAADRLALLLERIDELPLRSHDFQGNPAALLASFIERIDSLKAELVTVEEYADWAGALASGEAADRELEVAAVYRAHDA